MPDPLSWLYLSLSIILIILSGIFSLTETAFSSLNKYRFEAEAKNGSRSAKHVLKVYEKFDSTLVTILLGINMISVILSVIFTDLFLMWIPSLDDSVTSLIASLILTLVLYFFGETIPKQVARKMPNRCAKLTVYFLQFFMVIFYPLTLLFKGISFLVKKATKNKEEPELTQEDFTSVIEKNEEHGLLEENESDIIQNSLDFNDTKVKEILTPKKNMYMIDMKGLSSSELAKIICSTSYSRIPMYYEEKGQVVGVLIVKRFLAAHLENPNLNIKDYIDKPYIVSPSIDIDDLADGFKLHHTQIALVYQNGKLIGMVTMEDVLEELVGDIGEKNQIVSPRGIRK